MLETAIVSVATFFATIGPLDVAAIFAALTAGSATADKRAMAVRGVCVAGIILFAAALIGEPLLDSLGISLPAFRAAGGILLLLIGIDMVFARASGISSTTREETREAAAKADISVFPLAMPLMAGPGSIGAAILLMTNAEGKTLHQLAVLGGLFLVLAFTLAMLLLANQVQKLLGVTGLHVITRVFGILLTALAVQFIFDGVAQSGLLSG